MSYALSSSSDNNPSSIYLALKNASNYYQLLFPYLELENGPKVTTTEQDNCFFTCSKTLAQNATYQAWAKAKEAGSRDQEQSIAVNYINSDQFIRYPQHILPELMALLDEDFSRLQNIEDAERLIEQHFGSIDEAASALASSKYQSNMTQLWLSVFSLIIVLDYEINWRDQMLHLLKQLNVLEKLIDQIKLKTPWSLFSFEVWLKADLLLPIVLFPLPVSTVKGSAEPLTKQGSSVRPYSIGTLHRVEYKLIGYGLGELQKVESIMQGELRESQLDLKLNSTNEQSINQDESYQDDALSTHKEQDLLAQVQHTLANKKTVNTLDNYATQYIATSANASTSGSWTIDENPTGGESQKKADFIKDVLAKTEQRVSQNVSRVKQVTLAYEQASRERQQFQNGNEKHVNGFYYWLNKRYRVRALESQKRMMIEISLDFKGAELHQQLASLLRLDNPVPKSLAENGVARYSDISPVIQTDLKQGVGADSDPKKPEIEGVYYLDLYQVYNLEPQRPAPKLTRQINASLRNELNTASQRLEITPGYYAKSLTVSALAGESVKAITLLVAGEIYDMTANKSSYSCTIEFDEEIEESIIVSVLTQFDATTSSASKSCAQAQSGNCFKRGQEEINECSQMFSLNLELALTQDALYQWQISVYEACNGAYQAQLALYNRSVKALRERLLAEDNQVTLSLINRELVKMSIRSLYDHSMAFVKGASGEPRDLFAYQQYFDFSLEWEQLYCQLIKSAAPAMTITKEAPDVTSRENSEENQGSATTDEGNNKEPDQQTPDDKVSPSFPHNTAVSGNCEGVQTLPVLSELDSELFLYRFLKASQAKLLVPVKQGYEKRFIYFYETGRIWHGKEALTPVHLGSLALLNDFKRIVKHDNEERVIDDWQVCLPTVMSVIDTREELHHIGEHLDDRN